MNKLLKTPEGFEAACQKIKILLFDCDGVLTDGRIVLGSNGTELKFFSTSDGMGLKLWREAGFLSGSITGRASEALTKRASELKFDELHQGVALKSEVLDEILQRRSIACDEVAYVGDDLNDLSVGTRVGLFFIPANHNPAIKPYADFTLSAAGGHGAVREVIDLILTQKGLMEGLIKTYLAS
ncbi:MAG: 3-deoxy-D-manno-octulosonate 8-phosphate phosphatase [Erysipelotrichia bacterium]|nr:3-deoxy-D-manno-octulosonate 8-phosphate phosphatase [Erysipelotrichia bacterium]